MRVFETVYEIGFVINFSVTENEDTCDAAVDALKQIIAVKSHVVLPFIVPKVSHSGWNVRMV